MKDNRMDFLKANYHAHTWRCQHAYDTEREYIEAAISMGIEIFGFSDHVPCPYQDGYVSNIRMTMKQAPEYVETIRRLEAEYRDQIKIYAGFELIRTLYYLIITIWWVTLRKLLIKIFFL